MKSYLNLHVKVHALCKRKLTNIILIRSFVHFPFYYLLQSWEWILSSSPEDVPTKPISEAYKFKRKQIKKFMSIAQWKYIAYIKDSVGILRIDICTTLVVNNPNDH